METQATRSIHPLWWVTAIAVVLFSGVGIAALLGWIPTSVGKPADPAIASKPERARPAARTPAAALCTECGVVQSVQEIEARGEGSGLGAAGGAEVGGVLGNHVGGGDGRKVATVIGAVGGAVLGNEIEKRVKTATSYEISVRFDDGSSRVYTQAEAPAWRSGDKVKVVNGVIQSNS